MATVVRSDIRNVAIIAHVDHGKTTLVDAMLRQSGTFQAHEAVVDRIMDSTDLEREKGITILAKNAAVRRGDVKINIIDTPGHADFGGEVERGLSMVDGVLLLVDASEGPLPQTRFVLRKSLEARLPVVLVINKIDRSDARIKDVIDEVYELFLDLDAADDQIDFPIVYTDARAGTATLDLDSPGDDLQPLFDALMSHIPAPVYEDDHPFQALVTNLDASLYVGRLALCRVRQGTIRRGDVVAHCRLDGSVERVKITELYVTEALGRVDADEAGPGEIIAIAGLPDVTIGETLTDPEDSRPLPAIAIDEPSISMTIGINTSPFVGKEGDKLTARLIENRLAKEVIGNVSIRVSPSELTDTWVVQGRGELQLAVLIETMRREGFEMTVGKPEVVTRLIDGKLHEPIERLSIDVPEAHMGAIAKMMSARKGRMEQMVNHGQGRVRMDFLVPARGLIGLHNAFMVETRGTGLAHHVFEKYEPWHGDLRTRRTGSLVADRPGSATEYALLSLQERGQLFVGPGAAVYEGMIVGENPRQGDMNVNPTRPKKQTNMRAAAADQTEHLDAHRSLSLEQALEFITTDECLEVSPESVRLRKVVLGQLERGRTEGRQKKHAQMSLD